MKVIKATKKVATNAKYPSDLKDIYFDVENVKVDKENIHVKLNVYSYNESGYKKEDSVSATYTASESNLVVPEIDGALHSGFLSGVLEGSKSIIENIELYGLTANDLQITEKP